MSESLVHVEVDGIPVTIETAVMGKLSCLRLMRTMQDESAGEFERTMAAIDFGEKVLGAEQLENVLHSLSPDGDPDGADFIAFVFSAIKAASEQRACDPKN